MKESTGDPENSLMLSREEIHSFTRERVSEISREFTAGFEFLENYPQSVTFFGSTTTRESDPYYKDARALSARIVKEFGYSIITGGGPGIMEAANRGAYDASGNSLGLTINLPLGQRTNKYIQKEINFYYFFVRKVCLAFSAEAFIFYPGGFGTLDEFYELITLIQTRKIKGVPLICVGSEYWNKLKDFMKEKMLNRGAVALSDLELFAITDNHDIIMEIIRKVPVRSSIPFSNHENKEF